MNQHGLLFTILVYLLSAIIAVPIARKLGLGAVLGYLIAGVLVGPWGLSLITNAEDILRISEFGVVMLLFLIGLELNPKRLWDMRKPIFGTGTAQVIASASLLAFLAYVAGFPWPVAVVAGMGLTLSSTAIALQILGERNLLSTQAGRTGFSILLLQDLAVIPMLALIPLLAPASSSSETDGGRGISGALMALGVIAGIVLAGRTLMRPLFRIIAGTRMQELFTALSLLLIVGIALLMETVHLSMALGTFLAGVILAESEYRHELQANIEPFKGLLLGLFFVAVGMSIDFGLLRERPGFILGAVACLVAVKSALIVPLARLSGVTGRQTTLLAAVLSQAGEFAFVLFGVAATARLMDAKMVATLNVIVALSMLTTPGLVLLWDKFTARNVREDTQSDRETGPVPDENNTVVVAGFGRFGQIVARLLHANDVTTTIIDHSSEQVENLRKFGFKVYFGDATQSALLHAAGVEKAKLFVVASDDRETTLSIVRVVKEHFPHVRVLARAWDLIHVYDLLDLGVNRIRRETFESAVLLGEDALKELGFAAYQARRAAQKYRYYDYDLIEKMYAIRKDDKQYTSVARASREELERLIRADAESEQQVRESAWK